MYCGGMLYLTEADVARLLSMGDAIRLVRESFERLAAGEAVNQPRRRLILPTRSVLHYMAAWDGRYFGSKIYSTHPAHGARLVFLLYRAEDAELLAVIQANLLGQIRTGAVSAVATQFMARPDSNIVGIIGTGFQARAQLAAIRAVLPRSTVRVWSRSLEQRAAFAGETGANAVERAEDAVRGADVVVTATNAREPVLEDAWVGAGTHIVAMGSNQAARRELPAELVRRAGFIVTDSLEQARMESGDLILALDEEGWNSVVELKEIAAGRVAARTRRDQITLFKSNGLAVEDVVCAGWIYQQAMGAGMGRNIPPVHS